MIVLILLAALATAVGQPLCNPQCNFQDRSPYEGIPSVSICISAGVDQLHDYLNGTGKFAERNGPTTGCTSLCLPVGQRG